ncbi:ATP-dependent DNA helicase RecQ [Aurantibacter sp.]|uniref:RecQ family ATP-dependent DNA helicase n=1 Tax=Aurantibacter sp. TaxID=2807103 RepID=UPI0035C7D3E0
MQHPLNILEKYFNYTEFKPLQEEIIDSVISGEDTLALMPTGGGKSLCFQIPALSKEGLCIVISPLVALMKDQVKALTEKGIKAMALNSGISQDELSTKLDNCIYGKYKFLYLSPERLQQEIVQERIKQMPINLIAVDEAHCISQWGNDFRPAYKNINLLRTLQPTVNIIALTASATPLVAHDIKKELDFISSNTFKTSFKRDNLAYMVFNEEDKLYRLETILRKNTASSIVYVRNRRSTLEVSQYLKSKNITATFYNGGLTNVEKETNYNSWMNNQAQVMVATNAFGMGIDKADVKTVVHLNLPESIESYFQEAGRAGRNKEKAFAVILCNTNDEEVLKNQFLSVLPSVDYIKTVYKKLNSYFQIAYGEFIESAFDFDFTDFCKHYKFNYTLTYNSLRTLDRVGIISLSKQFNTTIFVQFLISSSQLFKYLETHQDLVTITKSILRTYGGIFEYDTKINLGLISKKTNIPESKIIFTLKQLEKDDVINFKHNKTDASISFLQLREDDLAINRVAKIINQQNKLKETQVASVLEYIKNENVCKTIQLTTYFGEKLTKKCGICSVCIKENLNKSYQKQDIAIRVLDYLKKTEANSRTLFETLKVPEEQIKQVIHYLLEHSKIEITPNNNYKIKIK